MSEHNRIAAKLHYLQGLGIEGAKKVLRERVFPGLPSWTLRPIATVIPYRKSPESIADWERDYAMGRWEYLRSESEIARYSVIAGYCRLYGPAVLLDVGCGEGLLAKHLGPDGYRFYLGIDHSKHAIDAARESNLPKAEFQVADAETFKPASHFDVIVFNEVLYYLDNPVAQLRRWSGALRSGGVFVVSLYNAPRARLLWPSLRHSFDVKNHVLVRHENRFAWDICILKPQR